MVWRVKSYMCVEFGPIQTHKEVFGRLLELQMLMDCLVNFGGCFLFECFHHVWPLLLVARYQGACRRFHYTNMPTTDALLVTNNVLNNDTTLQDRTNLLPDEILELLEFLLCTTFFVFNGEFHQQTDGVAMGGPASSIVAEIYSVHDINRDYSHDDSKYSTKNMGTPCWWCILHPTQMQPWTVLPAHQQSASKN